MENGGMACEYVKKLVGKPTVYLGNRKIII